MLSYCQANQIEELNIIIKKEVINMKFSKLACPIVLILFVLTSCLGTNVNSDDSELKENESVIRVLVPGNERTKGFMASGFRGFSRIKSEIPNVNVGYLSDLDESNEEILTNALRDLAKDSPHLIIAVGGQNDKPAATVSKEFPDIQFVVVQGSVQGENLSSYYVKQDESAYLAGALAGLLTETDIVGHVSGTTQQSGLDARGAFYNGLQSTNPEARFLTTFTGDMDDVDLNKKAAAEEIDAGADYIFTMLNDGRNGADDAIRVNENKVYAIGNAIDWTQEKEFYIASAIADPSIAVFTAAKDFVEGNFESNTIKEFGLDEEEVVNLSMRDTIPLEIQEKIEEIKGKILAKEIQVDTNYSGEEFK